jgi:hypothetical protein
MDRCTPECSHEGTHTRRRWRRSARPRRRAPPRDDASRLVWPPHSASTCPRPRVSTTYPNDDRHGWGEPRPVSYPIRAVNNPSSQRAHLYLDRSGPPPWLAFRTAAGADGTRGEVRRWEDARVASWRLVGWGGPPCLRLSVARLTRSIVPYCAWQRTCMRCTARRAALAVLLLTALPVSRGWSVMDQYYRIGTRLWSFSDSGITEPSAFVHDPRHVHGRAAAGPRARA